MSEKSPRKSYSREYKIEAVRMTEQPGKTVAEVARELDIRENDLHAWKKSVNEQGENSFPGRGRRRQDEVSALKRELKKLREENNILKKAAIFFAKETDASINS